MLHITKPPYWYDPLAEQPRAERLAAMIHFVMRLKRMTWLTMPISARFAVPVKGCAITVRSPSVAWTWRLKSGEIFVSDPLLWLGFAHDDPDFPFSLN